MSQISLNAKDDFRDFLSEQEEIDLIMEDAKHIFAEIQRPKTYASGVSDMRFSVFPRNFNPRQESKYEGHEFEIRFGTFDNKRFVPGVPKEYFYNLLNKMQEKMKTEPVTSVTFINQEGIRIIETGQSKTIDKKVNLTNTDYPEFGIRVSISHEEKRDEKELKRFSDYGSWTKRRKTRWSYTIGKRILDLTISTSPSRTGEITSYEVEIEYPESHATLVQDYMTVTSHLQKSSLKNIMSDNSISVLISNFNGILSNKEFDVFDRVENKPGSFDWSNVFYGGTYYLTPKLDGVRRRLFFDVNGVFEVAPGTRYARQIYRPVAAVKTIIDAEFYNGKYYPFDILAVDGRSLLTNPFSYRLESLSTISFDLFAEKPFFSSGNFYDGVVQSLKWMKDHNKMKFDGVIAQSNEPLYAGLQTMKIKPLEELTVDLYTRIDDMKQVRLYSWSKEGLKEENFSKPGEALSMKSELGRYTTVNLKLPKNVKNDFIAEYRFIQKEPFLVFKGFRNEKINPNFHRIVDSVYKDYFITPVSFDDLTDKTLLPWRKWASSVKRKIINDFVPAGARVLDIGIGRGGTMQETARRASVVFGVDPDTKNIESLTTRIAATEGQERRLLDKIQILEGKGQETDKIIKFIGGPVDVVMSFFSLSFFYKSNKDLDAFVETCKMALSNGGKVILMFMDGERTRRALIDKTVSPLVSITSSTENPPKDLVGVPITIDLLTEPDPIFRKQKEWLAPFDILSQKLIAAGFSRLGSSDGFLDKGAVLPPHNMAFAKMNRVVIFEKGEREQKLAQEDFQIKSLKVGEQDKIGTHWIRFGVKWDESSFLRSFLYTVSDQYKKDQSDSLVTSLRAELVKVCTRKVFDELKGGKVSKRLAFNLLFGGEKRGVLKADKVIDKQKRKQLEEMAYKAAYDEYINRLKNGMVGHEAAGLLTLIYPNRKVITINDDDIEIDRVGKGSKTSYILKVGTYAYSPITKAPGYIHMEPVEEIYEDKQDENAKFIRAVNNNDNNTIDEMIINGVDVSANGNKAIKNAIMRRNHDLVQKLAYLVDLDENVGEESLRSELIRLAGMDNKMIIILGGETYKPFRKPQVVEQEEEEYFIDEQEEVQDDDE